MRSNKQMVSFLSPENQSSYTFSKVKAKRLIDEVRHHAEKLLTDRFVKKHLN